MSTTQKHGENKNSTFSLTLYPIDMSLYLSLSSKINRRNTQALVDMHPGEVAQHALMNWNKYLETEDDSCAHAFLSQANWLVEHEVRIGTEAGGWPTFSQLDLPAHGLHLSALTQGCAISVLLRAYQLVHDAAFLETAARAIATLKLDILDGGVKAPIGKEGIFFEEIAVYPATHKIEGFIFALFGLYDYRTLNHDVVCKELIEESLATFHAVVGEFDAGYWTYSDLLHRQLTSEMELARQILLLAALADRSNCKHCSELARSWQDYSHRIRSSLRYRFTRKQKRLGHAFLQWVQRKILPKKSKSSLLQVCVPLNSLFVTGGILTVLRGVVQVTSGIWNIEFLTRYVGERQDDFVVHEFGTQLMAPWQFPTVWVYAWDGFWKLIFLARRGAGYQILMPQDGVFSAAFAGVAAKFIGARVVCIDHANLTLIKSDIYRDERKKALGLKKWPHSLISGLLLVGYWPSLYVLARIAASTVDHFLVPGIEGDGVEDICNELGIHKSRLTRFSSMIDINRHILLDDAARAKVRIEKKIAPDDVVVAIICRLSAEKGLEIALGAIKQALMSLPSEVGKRLRVVIAGDGPLRQSLAEDIQRLELSQTCVLWGDISAAEVITLLAISDIFLYTSTRGACIPMAVLEAMASACAVIATTQPMANAELLAEGRGIVVPPGDVAETATALIHLAEKVDRCGHMGTMARNYIASHHNAETFRRTLLRATSWSNLSELLHSEQEIEAL